MDSLEVEVDVSENFIHRVHPDQPATVRLNAYPDWPIPAGVIAVIPTADRAKATVQGARCLQDQGSPDPARDGRARRLFWARLPTSGKPATPGVNVPADAVRGGRRYPARSSFCMGDSCRAPHGAAGRPVGSTSRPCWPALPQASGGGRPGPGP